MTAITYLSTGERLAARALATATRKGGQLTLLKSMTGLPVVATANAGGPTADWRFDGTENTHHVRLGDRFHTQVTAVGARTLKGNDKHALKFAAAVLRHERWHGLITVRDVTALAKACRAGGAPFSVLNLLEDCRIEAKAASVEAEDFDWTRWINKLNAESPLHALFNIKLSGGLGSTWCEQWGGAPVTDQNDVLEFYRRACSAADSWEVVKLAIEWVKRWGGKATEAPAGLTETGHIHDDIGDENDGSAVGPTAPTPDAPSAEGDYGVKVSDDGREETPAGAPRTNTRQGSLTDHIYPLDEPRKVDVQAANRMATKLAETLTNAASAKNRQLSTNGSRLHVPSVAGNGERQYTTHTDVGGAPNIVMVMDMSGSMESDFDKHGRTVLAAMARLLRSGDVTGSIWLTGEGEHSHLPSTASDKLIGALVPMKSSEGVAVTLDALKNVLTEADVVIVYTDGMLTDGSVDAGMWRARGVDLIGAIVIPTTAGESWRANRTADMKKHFGRAIVGSTGLDLANKIVAYTAERVAAR
jgi:hypothetical protein